MKLFKLYTLECFFKDKWQVMEASTQLKEIMVPTELWFDWRICSYVFDDLNFLWDQARNHHILESSKDES